MAGTISSMTGFARASGQFGGMTWAWEARSVNSKGLDVRIKLPAGYDRLEQPVRALILDAFKRGSLQLSLQLNDVAGKQVAVINRDLLEQLAKSADEMRERFGGPAIDVCHLLQVKGVVEQTEISLGEQELAAIDSALLDGLREALLSLSDAKRSEGKRLSDVLAGQISRIENLTDLARENPSRQPAVILQKLKEQVSRLGESGAGLDPQRLHQEAVLLATKADIQEEIDRLFSHVAAARQLLGSPEPVGRKLEFLVQEFNREANTLCAKSSDAALTAIGLELKTVIDQLREQVQNIE